jgi:hypothetical protein
VLGEGWGGAPMQGRGGMEDGLTDGGAWPVGTESRSGGIGARLRRSRTCSGGGGGGDQRLRCGLGATTVRPMDGARWRRPRSA